ncbi:transmembrane GTPase fzo-like isoform X1 [Lytechinus variegatus]|uniref:transmembrane GTPase fzo-like isoform X1 n=1 Tax=Lytechinus variegatus TaxID=7654 RepID=UPI001BB14E84|nr:transmembrane GTPase fzo-like isoform X1 [Lytechinus variegatus]
MIRKVGMEEVMDTSRLDSSEAHLEKFAKAKREQRLIYDVTGHLITRIKSELEELKPENDVDIDPSSLLEKMKLLEGRIESLTSDLLRKKMKVAFFGGTSSGKTTTLNAMIGRELLPSGMGDTTSCFIQIEKMGIVSESKGASCPEERNHFVSNCSTNSTMDNENDDIPRTPSYFVVREVECREKEASLHSLLEDRQPLDSEALEDLCDAKSIRSLDATYLIEIHLSGDEVTNDNLLNYDLQIMDCPGITKCRELGDRVKTFCADSDVHVFIVNPKTVMSPEERDHFVEVGKRLPKPDIIVGYTQWDLAARERRPEEVKARHVDSVFGMLKELDVVSTREEAQERCFFYSGREALDLAIGEKEYLVKGWEKRREDFKRFISKIEERATSSGMTAKLKINRDTCQEILLQCFKSLEEVIAEIQKRMSDGRVNMDNMTKSLELFQIKRAEFVKESDDKKDNALKVISESVLHCMNEVSKKMTQTLKRSSVINRFEEDQVHRYAENALMNWYRKMLAEFQRATEKVCDDYSFGILELYEKHMKDFPHQAPRAFQIRMKQLEEEAEIPEGALQRALTGITERAVWSSFASRRRRISAVETDEERNILLRRIAAAAGVFFTQVRQWIRASIESKLENLTSSQQNSLICLEDVKKRCYEAVEAFCNSADVYYTECCTRDVEQGLKVQLATQERKNEQMKLLSKHMTNLKEEADHIRGRYNMDMMDDKEPITA